MTQVFKVFSVDEFASYKRANYDDGQYLFQGSTLDLTDGFIHLSDKTMAQEVIKLYFKDQKYVYLVEFLIPQGDEKLEKLPGIVVDSFCYHYHGVFLLGINFSRSSIVGR
jgi:uncharacterized protein (DUF952 family)